MAAPLDHPPFCYQREFLNLPGWHEGAFVLASLAVSDDPERQLRYQLHIGNCDKIVKLSIDYKTLEGRTNTRHKLRVLREALSEFSAALEQWFEEHPLPPKE